MRDSIITCLQQELAVVKAEKAAACKQDDDDRDEALETYFHLLRTLISIPDCQMHGHKPPHQLATVLC